MNHDEKIAYEFLKARNSENIEFEPLGKSQPPDFSINDNIAIEVRRLNKLVPIGDNLEAIEKLRYKFEPKLCKLIDKLRIPDQNYSVIVSIGYERPLKLTNSFWNGLENFIIENTIAENFQVNLDFKDNTTVRLYKRDFNRNYYFHLGAWSDRDQGGIVQNDRYIAIKESIKEKEIKTNNIKDNYREIWLILIDHIYSHVDSRILIDLEKYPKLESSFEKIIILSRFDPEQSVELDHHKTSPNIT
jgi:hypothetical protein